MFGSIPRDTFRQVNLRWLSVASADQLGSDSCVPALLFCRLSANLDICEPCGSCLQLQQQTAAHAASAAPPQTMQEALTSPHGRPPVALLAFGFGGRVVVMRPRTRQPLPMSPPQGALARTQ